MTSESGRGPDDRSVVLATLEDLAGAISKRDARAVAARFEPDASLLGTAAYSVGSDTIENYARAVIENYDTFFWEWDEQSLVAHRSADVLWFSLLGNAVTVASPGMPEERTAMRLTGVLRGDGKRWRWAQFHGSVAVTD